MTCGRGSHTLKLVGCLFSVTCLFWAIPAQYWGNLWTQSEAIDRRGLDRANDSPKPDESDGSPRIQHVFEKTSPHLLQHLADEYRSVYPFRIEDKHTHQMHAYLVSFHSDPLPQAPNIVHRMVVGSVRVPSVWQFVLLYVDHYSFGATVSDYADTLYEGDANKPVLAAELVRPERFFAPRTRKRTGPGQNDVGIGSG